MFEDFCKTVSDILGHTLNEKERGWAQEKYDAGWSVGATAGYIISRNLTGW